MRHDNDLNQNAELYNSEPPPADPALLKRVAARMYATPGVDFFTQLQRAGIDPLRQLRASSLVGFNLYRTNLSGADLRGTDLSRTDLTQANLCGADLSGAKLQIARLEKTNLIGANLDGADLQQANLRKANLQGADFTRTNLRGSNLLGAQLKHTKLVEKLGDFSLLLVSPRHLLSYWPGTVDYETKCTAWKQQSEPKPPLLWGLRHAPLDLPPQALQLIVTSMVRVLLEAMIIRNTGILINKTDQLQGWITPFLYYTSEEIAEILQFWRQDLIALRRSQIQTGNQHAAMGNLTRLGDFDLLSRNHDEAAQFYHYAQDYYQSANHPILVAELEYRLGCLALDQLDRSRAIQHIMRGVELYSQIGKEHGKMRGLLTLTCLALLVGDLNRARTFIAQTQAQPLEFDREGLGARRSLLIGALKFAVGELASALLSWQEAQTAYVQQGAKAMADSHADSHIVARLHEITTCLQANSR